MDNFAYFAKRNKYILGNIKISDVCQYTLDSTKERKEIVQIFCTPIVIAILS